MTGLGTALLWALTGGAVALSSSAAPRGTEVAPAKLEAAPRIEDFDGIAARGSGIAARMTRVFGFVNRLPRDGESMSERTEVYFGYDDTAVHAVFVCFDSSPGEVRAHLAGRDLIPGGDDSVAFQIDTFQDGIHAYGFQVNPLGVQNDGLWTEGKGWDLSFDTTWRSEGRKTAEGYVVVISVPFRSLRFRASAEPRFGVMLFRGIARTNEQGFWPSYSTAIAGRMNQAGVLRFGDQLPASRSLQVTPYLNARSFRTLETLGPPRRYARDDADGAMGFDLKFVPRENVTLDLALQPDFSQVESDEPQVTVNRRFEVFFPEKRPFFLENAPYFDTPIPLFFSRRIQDPSVGARLTARAGSFALGGLVARDDAFEGSTQALFRANRDIASQSTLGLLGILRDGPGLQNEVGAIDTRLRLGTSWSADAQIAASRRTTDGIRSSGFAARANLRRTGRSLNYAADFNERSAGFESVLGFIDRVDLRSLDQSVTLRAFPRGRALLSWGPDLSGAIVRDRAGHALEHQIRAGVTFEWPRQTLVSLYRQDGQVRVREAEVGSGATWDGISPAFGQDAWGVSLGTSPWSGLAIFATASSGGGINLTPAHGGSITSARERALNASVEIRPNARLALTLNALETRLHTPSSGERIFRNRILRVRTQFQFSRAASARAIVQYDALDASKQLASLASRRRFNVDALFTYLLTPGTALYIGTNEDRSDLEPGRPFVSVGRQVFAKVSVAVRK